MKAPAKFKAKDRVVYIGKPRVIAGHMYTSGAELLVVWTGNPLACTDEYLNSYFKNESGILFYEKDLELNITYHTPLSLALR